MMLEGKNAVIYGDGGSLGGAVAEVLAAAGAKKDDTMLKTLPSMADIANVALFLSSDLFEKNSLTTSNL